MDPIPPTRPSPLPSPGDTRILQQAKALEASFLAEMLKYSGLDDSNRSAFGAASFDGGAGEAQFNSFLRAEQARLMVERGGIGLAAFIADALERKNAG